jgi:hypothetical protein
VQDKRVAREHALDLGLEGGSHGGELASC